MLKPNQNSTDKNIPMTAVEAELKKFEEEERQKLGLKEARSEQWQDTINREFYADQREYTTILVSGLTMAHDLFVGAGLKGLSYKILALDCPDNDALNVGKEYGNRGQCNPTYFTVGNLVKYLITLRDKHGLSSEEIVKNYCFLTAGACGPCRFGMYVTEYRKALRDAGFDGFRVVLFQQTGGFSQATGEDVGLKMDFAFFTSITRAVLAGDVLNAGGYRLRPYEVEPGATDRAMQVAKKACYDAFVQKTSVLWAL